MEVGHVAFTGEPDDPATDVVVHAGFLVGEAAFDDRVLNPEKFAEETEFRALGASADPGSIVGEEIRKDFLDGKGLFGDDDEDDD